VPAWYQVTEAIARVTIEVFLNSLWQGLALTALVWCLLRVGGRSNATTRYVIWLATLLAVICLPLIGTQSPSEKSTATNPTAFSRQPFAASPATVPEPGAVARLSVPVARPGENMTVATLPPVEVNGPRENAANNLSVRSKPQSSEMRLRLHLPGRWPLIVFGVWLVVAVGLMARLIWSYCYVQRLKRKCSPFPSAYQHRPQKWLAASGVDRSVRLCHSGEISVPMAVGLTAPVILIPTGMAEQLTESEVDQIILHELAHLRRWDVWTNLVQKLAEAVFFFHPAVRWIGRQLNLEREIACDDWVISLTGQPRSYAACLTRLVELTTWLRRLALAPGAVMTRRQISRRIEMLLDKKRNSTPRLSGIGVLTTLGVLAIAVVQCARMSPVIAFPERPTSSLRLVDQKKKPEAAQPSRERRREAYQAQQNEALARQDETLKQVDEALKQQDEALAQKDETLKQVDEALKQQDEALAQKDETLKQLDEVLKQQDEALAQQDEVLAATQQAEVKKRIEEAQRALDQILREGAQYKTLKQSGFGGEERKPVIPESELLPWLIEIARTDADVGVRKEAIRAIRRLDSEASVDALLQLYDALADVEVKKTILAHLLRGEGNNAKAIAKLTQVAKSGADPELRRVAFEQLARVGGDASGDALISIYDDSTDAKVKEWIIQNLGRSGSKRAIQKLMAVAKSDPDPKMRALAVRRLGSLDDEWPYRLLPGVLGGIGGALAAPPALPKPPEPAKPPR
jgi:beta-lactamase regulating signal transducer with metallopeptidase domain